MHGYIRHERTHWLTEKLKISGFSLFDEEGDGLIDAKNFRLIERVMLAQTKMGKEHRDHGGNVVHKVVRYDLSDALEKWLKNSDLPWNILHL